MGFLSNDSSDTQGGGRNIIVRILILSYVLYASVCVWRNPLAYPLVYYPLLAIHEVGHYIFSWGSEMLMVAGGSITQVAIPLLVSLIFLKQRDFFIFTSLIWTSGISIYNVGVYASDARECNLPLVAPVMLEEDSETIMHDWNRLLSHYDLLHLDDRIGMFFYVGASIIMGISIASMIVMTVRKCLPSRDDE